MIADLAKVVILPLEQRYIDGVLEIENQSFSTPWSRGMFEREIALSISSFYVALDNDLVVGYAGFWHIEDEAHIVNVAVHPYARSKGLGMLMLRFLLTQIEKTSTRRILLEVRRSNQPAQKLYARADFTVIGTRPRYYQDEDAILMERIINTKE